MEPGMTISDEDLLSRYQSGDESAFEELLERYRGPLFTVVARMVGNRSDAEDIFQETFYRVLQHGHKFDFEKKFSSWVYAIATNLCRDYLRKRPREPMPIGDEPPDVDGKNDPERDSFNAEVRKAMEIALAKLPEPQREVFVLRQYGGVSFKEIAKMKGANLNTVLGRMHLAIKKLRTEMAGFSKEVQ